MRCIKADVLKMKSTQVIWLHLYMPLLGLLIFLGYYSYSPWDDFTKIISYFQVLAIVFPILISIITSMFADQEFMAGGYQNLLISSKAKDISLVSKLLICLALGTISMLLAVIGFYFGFSIFGDTTFSMFTYIAVIGIFIGSNLFQYVLHFFLSLRFSRSVSIGVGVAESLITALFITGMGDERWPFLPCSWSVRFIGTILNTSFDISYVEPKLQLGLIISIAATIISIIMLLLWFTRWEGKKIED